MYKLIALAMVSMLALDASGTFAVNTFIENDCCHEGDEEPKDDYTHHNMLDSVNLTEQQRLQLRDLMHNTRCQQPHITNAEKVAIHKLITADKFDETTVRPQVEKMSQRQIDCKVDMIKVRNQMYNLLTEEQKTLLNQKYQQKIERIPPAPETQSTSAQKPTHRP